MVRRLAYCLLGCTVWAIGSVFNASTREYSDVEASSSNDPRIASTNVDATASEAVENLKQEVAIIRKKTNDDIENLKKELEILKKESQMRGDVTKIRWDDPFLLRINVGDHQNEEKEQRSKVDVASAIRVGDKVMFVARDRPEDIQELPPGFRCVFRSGEADAKTERGNVSLPSTELRVHGYHQAYYKTSSIWTCNLPQDTKTTPYSSVTIVPPSWVDVRYGNGTFQIESEERPERMKNALSLCGKIIYNVDHETIEQIKHFLPYYRRLGVERFTFYALEKDDRFELLQSVLKQAAEGYNDISLIVIPASYTSNQLYKSHKPHIYLDSITVNDCLWRERANQAKWTAMQFDFDEYLVGVPHLPRLLSAWPHDTLYARHFLPKKHVLPKHGDEIEISSGHMSTYGKTVFQTDKVEVTWVHAPTNPKTHEKTAERIKLLHFRRNRMELEENFAKKNLTWVTIIC